VELILAATDARLQTNYSFRHFIAEWWIVRSVQPVAPHTKSDESGEIIRTWIDECLDRHMRCIVLQMARIIDRHLPTRLLYTGQGKSPDRVRLCDSAHLSPTVQYATLSHVWGTNPHFKLTSENVERFLLGVAITDLPQTFRHAVELTNSLSLQYLWIDALCILQNNKADWERESSAMAGIYSGAIINIVRLSTPMVDYSQRGTLYILRHVSSPFPTKRCNGRTSPALSGLKI
jgi:Heterokaryon incompatibility protein (HET)